LIGLFRSRAALETEILVLRHQLNVLQRKSPKRVVLSSIDRLLLVGLYRLAPGTLGALKIIRPATLLRWHRTGFRAYWRCSAVVARSAIRSTGRILGFFEWKSIKGQKAKQKDGAPFGIAGI
jgi:hypothetical protein